MKQKYFALLLLVTLLMVGCQPATTRYLGALADQKEAVTLAQGEVKDQQWDDLYTSVNYSYQRAGDHLELQGTLSFSFSSQTNYKRVRDLKLKIFFLDKNLQVIEYYDIARTLSPDIEQHLKFLKTFKLQSGVTAFTFGYEGTLVDEAQSHPIWNFPQINHK